MSPIFYILSIDHFIRMKLASEKEFKNFVFETRPKNREKSRHRNLFLFHPDISIGCPDTKI